MATQLVRCPATACADRSAGRPARLTSEYSPMAQLIAQNLAPIMFAALVVFLLLGYPVAFALAANGLLFFFVAVELAPYAPDVIRLDWPLLQALPERVYQTMSNE